MASDTVLCPGCGITLRSFMQRCPRCGAASIVPIQPSAPPSAPSPAPRVSEPPAPNAASFNPPTMNPSRPLAPPRSIEELRRRASVPPAAPVAMAGGHDAIYVSPPDEVRRFPLFTRAQIVLMVLGVGLLVFGLVIGWLLWSRDQRDTSVTLGGPGLMTPQTTTTTDLQGLTTSATPDLNASPTPVLTVDDQVLMDEARKVLAAYNPAGVGRYKFTVKDGVITLTGEVEHAPEKEGATNVLRLLAGAKSVVNNLVINPALAASATPLSTPTGTPTPGTPEANPLLATAPTPASVPANPPPSATPVTPVITEAQRAQQEENERLQRELAAARQRESELQRQRESDAQRQREIEEALRRQQQEAARKTDPAPAPVAPPASTRGTNLRSGTVAWSGVVDGIAEIVMAGGSATVRLVSGEAVREARSSFSAGIPRAAVNVKLLNVSGRGSIQIAQQPSASNGYTTIVRIDDSANGGGKLHLFTLQWSMQ